jgi:hypothetical protein
VSTEVCSTLLPYCGVGGLQLTAPLPYFTSNPMGLGRRLLELGAVGKGGSGWCLGGDGRSGGW